MLLRWRGFIMSASLPSAAFFWLRVKPADRAWRSHSNMSVIAPLLAAQLIGTRFRKRPFKPLAAFPFLYVR